MEKTPLELCYDKACRSREDLQVLRSASAVRYRKAVAAMNECLTGSPQPEVVKTQLEVLKLRARDYRMDTLMQMDLPQSPGEGEDEKKLNAFQKVHLALLERATEGLADRQCFICNGLHAVGPENCKVFVNTSLEQRVQLIIDGNRCLNCVVGTHLAGECTQPPQCDWEGCRARHHWMIHGAERYFYSRGKANRKKKVQAEEPGRRQCYVCERFHADKGKCKEFENFRKMDVEEKEVEVEELLRFESEDQTGDEEPPEEKAEGDSDTETDRDESTPSATQEG